jgi:hypothetical protein
MKRQDSEGIARELQETAGNRKIAGNGGNGGNGTQTPSNFLAFLWISWGIIGKFFFPRLAKRDYGEIQWKNS